MNVAGSGVDSAGAVFVVVASSSETEDVVRRERRVISARSRRQSAMATNRTRLAIVLVVDFIAFVLSRDRDVRILFPNHRMMSFE